VLEESYDYTVGLFYGAGETVCDREELIAAAEAARVERDEIASNAAEKERELEERLVAAESDYRSMLEQFKLQNYRSFRITRREIGDDIRAMEMPGVEVCERYKSPQLPMSLKLNGKTYAMLHAMDEGVLLTAQLSEEYADELSARHPELCRSKFPKGKYWFTLPIDGAFDGKESVYKVLEYSRAFVEAKTLADIAAKKAKAAKKIEEAVAKKQQRK